MNPGIVVLLSEFCALFNSACQQLGKLARSNKSMSKKNRSQDYFASLEYPADWEREYRETGVVSAWKHFRRGSKPLGGLGGFGQYALQHLLRDRGIPSVTWLYVASIDHVARGLLREHKRWAPASPRRTLKDFVQIKRNWATMREQMDDDRFDALQGRIVEAGFTGYRGEPDLFCFGPDKAWLFAEAKRPKDELRPSQVKWFRVAKNVLGASHQVRLYRVIPAGTDRDIAS